MSPPWRVRRAVSRDAAVIRALRLRALSDAPDAFESSFDRESAWTPEDWRRWVTDQAVFVLDADPGPVGIVVGAEHWDDPRAGFLMSLWVEPASRGTGAADALVVAVVSWAETEGYVAVWLHVGRENPRARRVYERHGFEETGRELPREPQGPPEIEMCRALTRSTPPPGEDSAVSTARVELDELRRAFLFFPEVCRDKSPLYAALSPRVAEDPEVLAQAGPIRPGQPPVNLLLGAVHHLLLGGVDHPLREFYPSVGGTRPPHHAYPVFADFCRRFATDIATLVGSRRVQTNEVGRCGALLPAFARVAESTDRPLYLMELGASLGLNLGFDQYRYEYSTGALCGPPGAPTVRTESRGRIPIPVPERPPAVAGRVGVDISPVNPADEASVRWLEALIWPDQVHRLELFRGAVALARAHPPRVVRGDGLDLVPELIAAAPPQVQVVLFHSHAVYQMRHAWREAFLTRVAACGRARDLAHVSLEWLDDQPGPQLHLTRHGNGGTRTEHLAACDHHGSWVRWLIPSGTEPGSG